MSYWEFREGSLSLQANADEKDIEEAFRHGDQNQDNELSWDEFFNLYQKA